MHVLNPRTTDHGKKGTCVYLPVSTNLPRIKTATTITLISLGALYFTGCEQSQSAQATSTTVTQVGVMSVSTHPLTLSAELPGRTTAFMIAQIRPQIGGIVQKRVFEEGSMVKSGDLLYQIDPSSYQAAFESAKATVAKAEATLNAAELKAKRQAALLAIEAVSTQDYEDAEAAKQEAQASLAGAKADLETARINLAHTRITSPIAGRVETSSVTPGALVTASQETALTTVQQLDPIYVDIPQSSTEVLRLKQAVATGRLKLLGSGEMPIHIKLEDGTDYKYTGKLQFSGTTVNTTTGAITLRALIPNPDHLLMPGMYVQAYLDKGSDPAAILIPQKAVTRGSNGQATALVVTPNGKVELRNIAVAEAVGPNWHVTTGLAVGDKVIVEGVAKVRPGQNVQSVLVTDASNPSASDKNNAAVVASKK